MSNQPKGNALVSIFNHNAVVQKGNAPASIFNRNVVVMRGNAPLSIFYHNVVVTFKLSYSSLCTAIFCRILHCFIISCNAFLTFVLLYK